MGRPGNPLNPPCARCGAVLPRSKGTPRGRQRWHCLACGRSFGETLGTPLYRLKTDLAEIVRTLQLVLHRGSLRAAEEQTRSLTFSPTTCTSPKSSSMNCGRSSAERGAPDAG
jgi:transposase-like protein